MRALGRRPLTVGEAALARRVFADEIAYHKVQIAQVPPAGFAAMVPSGATIVFSQWRAPFDFTQTDSGEQGWFIHEMAHVWQASRGVILAGAKLSALGRAAYRYSLRPGDRLEAFNIEQQAEIARAVFHARIGRPLEGHAAPTLLSAVWPIPDARPQRAGDASS